MNNSICSNFEYNENTDGILNGISPNCKECEFDGNCDIKTAYYKTKDYVTSMAFVVKGGEDDNAT